MSNDYWRVEFSCQATPPGINNGGVHPRIQIFASGLIASWTRDSSHRTACSVLCSALFQLAELMGMLLRAAKSIGLHPPSPRDWMIGVWAPEMSLSHAPSTFLPRGSWRAHYNMVGYLWWWWLSKACKLMTSDCHILIYRTCMSGSWTGCGRPR